MSYDFFEQATAWLREAGETGGIDPNVMALMSAPARITSFRLPVKMDDGRLELFNAHRVRYNAALGPSRDGVRMSADLDLGEVKALALIMSIKHAGGHIPAGGGKGGIEADPRRLSEREREALCRAFMRHLRPRGPAYDVPGADIGTDLQSMAWMLDEYESVTGYHAPAAVNDKPVILGGTRGGYDATGRGVFDMMHEAAGDLDLDVPGARVAIQGFGQVGAVAAEQCQQADCRVVAVSDSRSAVANPDGLDVAALRAHKAETGGVADFPGGEALDPDALLAVDCDVLIPAAVQGVIHEGNAGDVRARLLVEAANAPTTVAAHAILAERGVTVVPDVLANAGSVQLCQMERTQGLYDNYWDADTVDRLRHERMVEAYRAARETAQRCNTDSMRLGAWINALRQIEEASRARGWC